MIDFALRLPLFHPWGSTTADVPHNPGMLPIPIPALPSLVDGYYTSPPVSGGSYGCTYGMSVW
jgi:hypothetical protein